MKIIHLNKNSFLDFLQSVINSYMFVENFSLGVLSENTKVDCENKNGMI